MIRRFVRSVIHNATVTAADHAWPVSLRLDPVLMQAMEILPLEEIEIVNVASGTHATAWVEAGAPGEVRVHGHARPGDVVTIISHGLLHDGQTLTHRARIVTLGPGNQVVSISEA